MYTVPRAATLVILALIALAPPAAGGEPTVLVSVTGIVTDRSTGTPIAGASVFASAVGPLGHWSVSTDTGGRYSFTLPPGTYSLDVLAPGYYDQNIGSPPADNGMTVLHVTASGPNEFDTALVPDSAPYLGIADAHAAWVHAARQPFGSMILRIDYGAYAALPPDWLADTLTVQLQSAAHAMLGHVDAQLSAHGGGGSGSGFLLGSTNGCDWLNSERIHRDVRSLRVRAFLRSNPAAQITAPLTVDRTQCEQTRLLPLPAGTGLIAVQVLTRAPSGQSVPGAVIVTAPGGRVTRLRVTLVRTLTGLGEEALIRPGRILHGARGTLLVRFLPSDPAYLPSPVLAIRVRSRPAARH